MLYLIATPIGNLQDLSPRALETLGKSDLILCEDTRHSLKLLQHYNISLPLKSYHKFNEASREEEIVKLLRDDKTISLISDAGMPGISDPGTRLVEVCIREQLPYTIIPGPSAVMVAALASGFCVEGYSFRGFFPKKAGEQQAILLEALYAELPSIFFISPRELIPALEKLKALAPEHFLFLGKEFTKQYEHFFHGTASTLLEILNTASHKGEWCLAIRGNKPLPTEEALELAKSLEESYKISSKEAIKLSAELLKIPKRTLYQKSLQDPS